MEKDTKIYELGYHLLPTLAEEEVQPTVEKIKEFVTKTGGTVFAEEAPQLVQLSYPIYKHLEASNKKYEKAYFGWLKFELEAEKAVDLHEFAKTHKQILRFILVKTAKDNVVHFHKSISKKEEKPEEGEPVTEEEIDKEIDKSIDELIIN